jgi:hypothetical protein
MEARQLLVDYKDAAKPLARIEIAKALRKLEASTSLMTRVERETYEFLTTEFKYELLKLEGDQEPSEVRWHLLSGSITEGIINLDINYRYSLSFLKDDRTNVRTQGIFRKASEINYNPNPSLLLHEAEIKLIRMLAHFPNIIQEVRYKL